MLYFGLVFGLGARLKVRARGLRFWLGVRLKVRAEGLHSVRVRD